MNQTEAIVIRVEGRHVWVEASGPGAACGGCQQAGSCTSAQAESRRRKPLLIRLPNTIGAQPGDAVIIRAAEGAVLRAAMFAYGVPLALALAGALAASALFGSEMITLGGLLLGLGAGFAWLRWQGLEARCREPILSLDFKAPSPSTVSFKDRGSC